MRARVSPLRILNWVLAASAVLALAYGRFCYLRPIRLFAELAKDPKRFSPDEARERLHANLRPPIHGHHDAFLLAATLGNQETVPLLIDDLRSLGDTNPGGMMVCTKGHCLEALFLITGQSRGSNYRNWKGWRATAPAIAPEHREVVRRAMVDMDQRHPKWE